MLSDSGSSPLSGGDPPASPRVGLEKAWQYAEAAVEDEADLIVRGTDAQLASLREAAHAMALGRRQRHVGSRARARTPLIPRRGCHIVARRGSPA